MLVLIIAGFLAFSILAIAAAWADINDDLRRRSRSVESDHRGEMAAQPLTVRHAA